MSYYIVKLVVFSLFIFLIIELVLNIMSFNMVTRGNAMANKSAQNVGSKRTYSGSYVTGANEPPTTSRFTKEILSPIPAQKTPGNQYDLDLLMYMLNRIFLLRTVSCPRHHPLYPHKSQVILMDISHHLFLMGRTGFSINTHSGNNFFFFFFVSE